MTREETIMVLAVLRGAYPAFYRGITNQEAESTIALWQSMFDEEPYEVVGAAVKAFIAADAKGYPPAIGQIKDKIRKITQQEDMTEQEAWAIVSEAIKRSTWYSAEEFEKLPPEIRAVVHNPDQLKQWAMCDDKETQTVIASNFMRSFKAKQQANKEYNALPSSVKQFMITAGYRTAPGEDGLKRLFGGEQNGTPGNQLDRENRLSLLDAGD